MDSSPSLELTEKPCNVSGISVGFNKSVYSGFYPMPITYTGQIKTGIEYLNDPEFQLKTIKQDNLNKNPYEN